MTYSAGIHVLGTCVIARRGRQEYIGREVYFGLGSVGVRKRPIVVGLTFVPSGITDRPVPSRDLNFRCWGSLVIIIMSRVWTVKIWRLASRSICTVDVRSAGKDSSGAK